MNERGSTTANTVPQTAFQSVEGAAGGAARIVSGIAAENRGGRRGPQARRGRRKKAVKTARRCVRRAIHKRCVGKSGARLPRQRPARIPPTKLCYGGSRPIERRSFMFPGMLLPGRRHGTGHSAAPKSRHETPRRLRRAGARLGIGKNIPPAKPGAGNCNWGLYAEYALASKPCILAAGIRRVFPWFLASQTSHQVCSKECRWRDVRRKGPMDEPGAGRYAKDRSQ